MMCDKCDNKELRKELEAVTLERDLLRKRIGEMEGKEKQLTEAREALKRYGKHDPLCAVIYDREYDCTCGLSAAGKGS